MRHHQSIELIISIVTQSGSKCFVKRCFGGDISLNRIQCQTISLTHKFFKFYPMIFKFR